MNNSLCKPAKNISIFFLDIVTKDFILGQKKNI